MDDDENIDLLMGNCDISKVDHRQSCTGTGRMSGFDNIGYGLKDVQEATEPGDSMYMDQE